MKVSDLIGKPLDFYVAKGLGKLTPQSTTICNAQVWVEVDGDQIKDCVSLSYFSPSTVWKDGGPVIDCSQFQIFERDEHRTYDEGKDIEESKRLWSGGIYEKQSWGRDLCIAYQRGPTMLIAAMRTFVASKFGEDVAEVPQN